MATGIAGSTEGVTVLHLRLQLNTQLAHLNEFRASLKRETIELFKGIMRALRSLMIDYSAYYASSEGEAAASGSGDGDS